MTIKSIFLFLGRYLSQNWVRVVLASAGIVIGVWSITLTTMLSFGVSDKIVTAINSQPASKSISVQKEESGATNFFQVSGPPKFVFQDKNKVFGEINSFNNVVEISHEENIQIFVNTQNTPSNLCVARLITPSTPLNSNETPAELSNPEIPNINEPNLDTINSENTESPEPPTNSFQPPEIPEDCYSINLGITNFSQLYEENKNNWLGKETAPTQNEIVSCFTCDPQNPLYKKLGANKPEDLIGKTINIEYFKTGAYKNVGEIFDVTNVQEIDKTNTNPKLNEIRIVSVIDDNKSQGGALNSQRNNFYGSETLLKNAINETSNQDYEKLGFTGFTVFVDDYANLKSTIDELGSKGYLASSPILLIIQGIQTLFLVISIVFGLFGFIALIASIFGITNVMAISVLKRQKEIGILKALGARNGDIFKIFALESLLLGVIGWLIGTVAGYISTIIFANILDRLVANNDTWRENLLNLGITDFNIPFDYRVALVTLVIASIVTLFSGLFPAIRASRSNPVETLKSE